MERGRIGRGTYRRRRALAVRPGSPDRSRMSGSGGALGGGQGDPRAATSTRPPRARPARGPEGRRPRAPSRGRGALPRGSAAEHCPARARAPQNSGLASESPCPGDLVKPRAGEPRGSWPSLPQPRDCYSGRRAQGRGMCANRGRPAPVPRARLPASSPPTRRSRPRDGSRPGSLAPPSRSAHSGVRPLELRSRGSRSTSRHPKCRAPGARRSSAPGVGREGRRAHSRPRISGRCCHHGTNPTPPPALPARPPDGERRLWSQISVQRSQFCMACPHPLRPQFPHSGKGGTATLSARLQLFARTGEIRVMLGLPPPHPFQRAASPHTHTQARSKRPLLAPPPAPHCHPRGSW